MSAHGTCWMPSGPLELSLEQFEQHYVGPLTVAATDPTSTFVIGCAPTGADAMSLDWLLQFGVSPERIQVHVYLPCHDKKPAKIAKRLEERRQIITRYTGRGLRVIEADANNVVYTSHEARDAAMTLASHRDISLASSRGRNARSVWRRLPRRARLGHSNECGSSSRSSRRVVKRVTHTFFFYSFIVARLHVIQLRNLNTQAVGRVGPDGQLGAAYQVGTQQTGQRVHCFDRLAIAEQHVDDALAQCFAHFLSRKGAHAIQLP